MLDKGFSHLEQYALEKLDKEDSRLDQNRSRTENYFHIVMYAMHLAEELKLESVFSRILDIICSHLNMFIETFESGNNNDEEKFFSLTELTFDLIKKIMEHPDGKLSWKIKTFDLWFSANEETFSDQEKSEILKFFKDHIKQNVDKDMEDSEIFF